MTAPSQPDPSAGPAESSGPPQPPTFADGVCAGCGKESRVFMRTLRCRDCDPEAFAGEPPEPLNPPPAGALPDQHHPEAKPEQVQRGVLGLSRGAQQMTRGEKARYAEQVLSELRAFVREDPSFDLARNYMLEAVQVLPTKAE